MAVLGSEMKWRPAAPLLNARDHGAGCSGGRRDLAVRHLGRDAEGELGGCRIRMHSCEAGHSSLREVATALLSRGQE